MTSSTSSSSPPKNPLHNKQTKYLSSLPKNIIQHYFSNDHIDAETRAQIWSEQAELGEGCVNDFAWATPDNRALNIIKHFSSTSGSDSSGVVEIGCGANAYWSRQMHDSGINVLAFDAQINQGGKINNSNDDDHEDDNDDDENNEKNNKKRKYDNVNATKSDTDNNDDNDNEKKCFEDGFAIYKGGPEVLSSNSNFKDMDKRVLFLCYPDEDVYIQDVKDDDNENDEESAPTTMGAVCLEHFQGDTIIHVGELVGDTISMDQAPWGRSSGAEFQQRLCAEYHCLIKAKLTNWLHVRDTISVWKRSKSCSIVFQGEDDDEDDKDEEVEYKYIPEDEILPNDIAAPCVKHLL